MKNASETPQVSAKRKDETSPIGHLIMLAIAIGIIINIYEVFVPRKILRMVKPAAVLELEDEVAGRPELLSCWGRVVELGYPEHAKTACGHTYKEYRAIQIKTEELKKRTEGKGNE